MCSVNAWDIPESVVDVVESTEAGVAADAETLSRNCLLTMGCTLGCSGGWIQHSCKVTFKIVQIFRL